MRRLALLSFAISLASVGCVVGDPTPGLPGSGAAPDASGNPNPITGGPDAAPQNNCEPASQVIPDGHHNEGQACLTCHNGQQQAAPLWTVAGTLYGDAAGTTPIAGATIIVSDAAGHTLKLITASDGNFYTGSAVTFPISVKASQCPNTAVMQPQQRVGDCNSCHGATNRVHLP